MLVAKASSKGMAETARNFVGSYVNEDRLVTVQYPEERLPQKEAARNFPFLVFDGDDWQKGLRCVACQICEKECPPQCIYIVKRHGQEARLHRASSQFQPKVFDIDTLGLHELPDLRRGLPVRRHQDGRRIRAEHRRPVRRACCCDKQQLAKSNEYYHKIHPTEAAEVDARLAAEKAKAEAKAKADAEAKAKAAAAARKAPRHSPRRATARR